MYCSYVSLKGSPNKSQLKPFLVRKSDENKPKEFQQVFKSFNKLDFDICKRSADNLQLVATLSTECLSLVLNLFLSSM